MTKRKIIGFAVALIFSATLLSHCSRPPSEEESNIQIGSAAPKFKLPDLNGREVTLDQFKGKVVMLDFWATWCGPCRMTMPLLERLQKEFPDKLVLLAINLQEPKNVVSDYVRRQGINSRVLLDEEGSVGSTYGTGSIPMQVLLDKSGIVRHVQVGYDPRMLSQLRTVVQTMR